MSLLSRGIRKERYGKTTVPPVQFLISPEIAGVNSLSDE